MTIASDLFRTVIVKIHDISQQLPYIVVNQADDNGKIIRFVPMDHGQKVTGFTGARLYYPPRSDNQYGDYVTGVESDGAWDFTIPVGALSVGRVECNLAFIDGNGETYSRNVVFLVEPAVSGVFDPEDGQQTRIDKIIGTVQDTADTAIGSINKTASDAVENIGKAEQSINESVTAARGSADAAAKISETNAAASATAAQQAVDGFGLEVGTTTTGEPGTDAAVEIQKTGTKYTANFTIPRGDIGPSDVNENVPLGTASGMVAQGTDAYPTLPRKVQVHGRTVTNLWPNFNKESTVAGMTILHDDSGFITIKGTSTSDKEQYLYRKLTFDSGSKKFFFISTINTDANFKIQIATDQASSYSEAFPTTQGITYTPVSDAKLFGCYIRWTVPVGESINKQFRVMLVEGDTNHGVFVPSGVHIVEPEKLIVAGKNLASITTNSNKPNLLISDILPPGDYVFSAVGDALKKGYNLKAKSNNRYYDIVSNVYDQTTKFSLSQYASVFLNMFVNGSVENIQIEKGASATQFEQTVRSEVNLPSDISLADGDTLTIDRDGTTQIIHAEGEPTVLDNVALPELPAPTFNVYTTGGYLPPTVDVTYERDVNLALDHEIPHDVTLVGNGTKSSPLGVGDLSSRYTPTTTYQALEARVQALEAKLSN